MPAYGGLTGGKQAAERINRGKKTKAAQREQARNNSLPGLGNF